MILNLKNYKAHYFVYILSAAIYLCLVQASYALIEVNVNKGKIEPLNIAVTDFLGENPEEKEFGINLADVIASDLESSGFFTPLNKDSFINPFIPFSTNPEFHNWRSIKSKFLVTGEVTIFNNRKAEIKFKLFDVTTQKQLRALKLTSRPANWRRIAHQISDVIYSRITGEAAYFDTQVVFIDESGPKTNRIKRLAIMDRDGYNPRFLTNGDEIVITPRFSPTNQEITYMSFSNNQPRVYLLNIATRQKEIVGELNGITFAPRFSPGGDKIIMSLLHIDASNIFTMDLRNRKWTRLTNSNSINTSPCYSPDGSKVVFESDRDGSKALYVMNSDGTGLTKISNGNGQYSTPVWSPKNNLIAFTKQYKGRFLIGVMNIDGTGERIITEGYHNEGPTWAPNGRVLMFFRDTPSEDGGPSLYSVDITGYNERKILTPNFASDPAWSPLIN